MAVVLTNNATSLLAGAITAGSTTLSIENADASKFPNPVAGDWFPLTIVDNAGNMEIVRATARAGAIITVERAQEDTTAKAFAAGTRVDVRLTAAALSEVGDKATTKTVGAAVAGANGGDSIADGDSLTGVLSGTSTLRRWTWGNIVTWLRTLFYTKTEVNSVVGGNMAGRAYPRRSDGGLINLVWSGKSHNPGYVWGIDEPGTNAYPHPPSSLSVGWANNAGAVNGWNIDNIRAEINWRVSDTRFAGYLQNGMFTTGTRTTGLGGSSGYVMTDITKNAVESCDRVYRQPQIHIPNVGWRALGAW